MHVVGADPATGAWPQSALSSLFCLPCLAVCDISRRAIEIWTSQLQMTIDILKKRGAAMETHYNDKVMTMQHEIDALKRENATMRQDLHDTRERLAVAQRYVSV